MTTVTWDQVLRWRLERQFLGTVKAAVVARRLSLNPWTKPAGDVRIGVVMQ